MTRDMRLARGDSGGKEGDSSFVSAVCTGITGGAATELDGTGAAAAPRLDASSLAADGTGC